MNPTPSGQRGELSLSWVQVGVGSALDDKCGITVADIALQMILKELLSPIVLQILS